MTIALPLTVIVAVGIWVLLEKTKLGYELRATGCNKFAAKYCGMKEKRNIILTMAIAGALPAWARPRCSSPDSSSGRSRSPQCRPWASTASPPPSWAD